MTVQFGGDRLGRDEVQVWWTRMESLSRDRLDVLVDLLPPEERERRARFRFQKDRDLFTAARGLVRTSLSRYEDRPAATWRFEVGPNGKPRLPASAGVDLTFNLSHTDGLVACAVARGTEVGIDVECLDRRQETMQLARRYFAPIELARLEECEEAESRATFFAIWTLKEAYLKARGAGITLPLREFGFSLDPLRVDLPASWGEDPNRWQFARWSPTDRHAAALAFYRPRDEPFSVRARHAVPNP